ncbi:uncharacterized protein LOC144624167 isoform X3 [Crassostrea virginica]
MTIIFLTVIYAVLQPIRSYENLARKNSTVLTQSTTYQYNNATLANNGDLRTTEQYCAHTAPGYDKAWFQVDFGSPFNILSVKIYFRREGNLSTDWKQYRFRQFYLDVSDLPVTQTTTAERTRCYTDNTTDPNLPPHIIQIPCKQTARFVIVETRYDAPEDFEKGAFLEICELEVYGCSPNCVGDVCDTDGDCTNGCKAGFWGTTCQSVCPINCKQNCHQQNGICYNCTIGYWGDVCNELCPYQCDGNVCDNENGGCIQGCHLGWYGNRCDKACSLSCATGRCEKTNGYCPAGCVGNWAGDKCERCDATHYGAGCSLECSVNCIQQTCNNITGSCTQGCIKGFYGDFCNNTCIGCLEGCYRDTGECMGACSVGTYGTRCEMACSLDCKSGCDKSTGICTLCVDGKFGQACNRTCSTGCTSGCDRQSGYCVCKPGW